MTLEERLQQVLGVHAFRIIVLEAEVEKLRAELAEKEKAAAPPDE